MPPLAPIQKLVVTAKRQLTPDVFSFTLAREDGTPLNLAFKPGQFITVSLLDAQNDQKATLTRSYSMASSPNQTGSVELAWKLAGTFTNLMKGKEPGFVLGFRGPFGFFTFQPDNPAHAKVAFVAGGIGVTPFVSMVRFACEQKLPNDIVLLYGARTPADFAFKDVFDQAAKDNPHFKVVYVISDSAVPAGEWGGERGYIDKAFLLKHVPDVAERTGFACGPPVMVDTVVKELAELGLPKERIKTEKF